MSLEQVINNYLPITTYSDFIFIVEQHLESILLELDDENDFNMEYKNNENDQTETMKKKVHDQNEIISSLNNENNQMKNEIKQLKKDMHDIVELKTKQTGVHSTYTGIFDEKRTEKWFDLEFGDNYTVNHMTSVKKMDIILTHKKKMFNVGVSAIF